MKETNGMNDVKEIVTEAINPEEKAMNEMIDVNEARTETTNQEGTDIMSKHENNVGTETINPTGEMIMNDSNENSAGTMQLGEGSTIFLDVNEIQTREIFRCRERENIEKIGEYAERYADYKKAKDNGENPTYPFLPIKVWYHNGEYILLGGHHRLKAALKAGFDKILVILSCGTEDEAFEIAMTDNQHGLPLTRGDLKLCIEKTVKRFSDRTPRVIADMLGCGRTYVAEIIGELSASGNVVVAEKRRGRDGKEYPSKRKGTSKPKKGDGLKFNSEDMSSQTKESQQSGEALQELSEPAKSSPSSVMESKDVPPQHDKAPEKTLTEQMNEAFATLNKVLETLPLEEYKGLFKLRDKLCDNINKRYKALQRTSQTER